MATSVTTYAGTMKFMYGDSGRSATDQAIPNLMNIQPAAAAVRHSASPHIAIARFLSASFMFIRPASLS
jgi:hypothetical protein